MENRVLILITLLIPGICSAQVPENKDRQVQNETAQSKACGGIDSVMAKKGSWKKISDDLAFPDKTFPRTQYKFVNTRVDSMLNLFKEALPQLNGLEPRWYRGMRGDAYIPNGPVPYSFTSLYFNYYCNTNLNKILLGDETGTWAYVFVNHLNWFCEFAYDWDINGDGKMISIYIVPPKVGTWKETTLYQPKAHGKFCRAVIIGHGGKMPWSTLSQKQYLSGLKNAIEKTKRETLAGHDSYEEKTKKATENIVKNMSPEQVQKLRADQEKNFETNRSSRVRNEKFYDGKLKPINDYLANNSEETLSKPAIIDPRSGISGFQGWFGDAEKDGIKLVALSGRYFNKTLPQYAPQFMVLYWRWTEHPASLSFKNQFEENLPLEKLKAMIDK